MKKIKKFLENIKNNSNRKNNDLLNPELNKTDFEAYANYETFRESL